MKPRNVLRGSYVGDVTALCKLSPRTPKLHSDSGEFIGTPVTRISGKQDTLLAGIGGSVHWYDPFKREGDPVLVVCTIFNAERIHGIVPVAIFDKFCDHSTVESLHETLGTPEVRALLVYGEQRVTIAALLANESSSSSEKGHLCKVANLPLLGHWVHDVLPLERETLHYNVPVVAVGLADNSVEQWMMPTCRSGKDVMSFTPRCIRRVECAMRSMLYSLALRGDSMNELEVAGGTIFNQIQLWTPRDAEDCRSVGLGLSNSRRPLPWAVLNGHRGSVMRVRWARHGASIFSTSDDRTARVWTVPPRRLKTLPTDFPDNHTHNIFGGALSLRGHVGRVWDCHLVTLEVCTLLVTAGEDCTVRLWTPPPGFFSPERVEHGDDVSCFGNMEAEIHVDEPLAVLRGHKGRGVWRVISIQSPSGGRALVSAGADASIKLWDLRDFGLSADRDIRAGCWVTASDNRNRHCLRFFSGPMLPQLYNNVAAKSECNGDGKLGCSQSVNIALQGKQAPGPLKGKLGGSKGEYVRVIHVPISSTIYVATNNGVLHRVDVLKGVKDMWCWREIYRINPCGPIVALTHVKFVSSAATNAAINMNVYGIVLGDIHGRVSVLFVDGVDDRKAEQECRGYLTRVIQIWHACEPRRLLDVFQGSWDNEHHSDYLFTSEVGGIIKWWRRKHLQSAWNGDAKHVSNWAIEGIAPMPFNRRVLAVSYHRNSRVMFCGDQAGNIAAFDGAGINDHGRSKHLHSSHTTILPLLAASTSKAKNASTVTFVKIRNTGNYDFSTTQETRRAALKFFTGGRDGCLCTFILRQIARAGSLKSEQLSSSDSAINPSDGSAPFHLPNSFKFEGRNASNSSRIPHEQMRICTSSHPSEEVRNKLDAIVSSTPYQFIRLAKKHFSNISTVRAVTWSSEHVRSVDRDSKMKGAIDESISVVAGFKNTEFIVIDASTNCELLRVQCGGWHRPVSLLIGESKLRGLSFAFCQGAKLTLIESIPWNITDHGVDAPDDTWNSRYLRGSSHGREIHTIKFLPHPKASSQIFGLLTGSEDGTIICHLHTVSQVGHASRQSIEVGTHIGGTAVRSLYLFPELAGGGLGISAHKDCSYILLSAGAKEVVMAWRVKWIQKTEFNSSDEQPWEIRTTLLAAAGRTEKNDVYKTLKTEQKFNIGSKTSDERCMAVVGFVPIQPSEKIVSSNYCVGCYVTLTAMSEGSLKVTILDTARQSVDACGSILPVAELRYHIRPIISLAAIAVPLDTHGTSNAVLVCSGATDGEIAIWDLTELSAMISGTNTCGFGKDIGNKSPVSSIAASHRSGVNSVAVARVPSGSPGRFIISSGGDDQSLRVSLLSVARCLTSQKQKPFSVSVALLRTVITDFAHGSSIKGVWMNRNGVVATTSHDQRLRMWTVCESGSSDFSIASLAGSFVDCPEPEALDACPIFCDESMLRVAISGRGLQIFHF